MKIAPLALTIARTRGERTGEGFEVLLSNARQDKKEEGA